MTANKSEKTGCVRQILPHVTEFRRFWKIVGPFAYALTSREYPPVLLAPEEWIFGHSARNVLEALMQFHEKQMVVTPVDLSRNFPNTLRPENLIPWRINNFPGEWDAMPVDFFLPGGFLTRAMIDPSSIPSNSACRLQTAGEVVEAFFRCLEQNLNAMGYVLLSPQPGRPHAAIQKYLEEWAADEADAGLI